MPSIILFHEDIRPFTEIPSTLSRFYTIWSLNRTKGRDTSYLHSYIINWMESWKRLIRYAIQGRSQSNPFLLQHHPLLMPYTQPSVQHNVKPRILNVFTKRHILATHVHQFHPVLPAHPLQLSVKKRITQGI